MNNKVCLEELFPVLLTINSWTFQNDLPYFKWIIHNFVINCMSHSLFSSPYISTQKAILHAENNAVINNQAPVVELLLSSNKIL